MLSLWKPTKDVVRAFLADQARFELTYSAVGATFTTPPAGYVVDHTRIRLGDGERIFTAARKVLEGWGQFRLGWVEACPEQTPIQAGQAVAVLAHCVGVWWLNACRIVKVVDDDGPVKRFGFAYGTLPDHAGTGEERFLIEWDRAEGSVWYDVLAFSRPRHVLVRLGYPVVRMTQRRFGRESASAVYRAVNGSAPIPAVCQRSHLG